MAAVRMIRQGVRVFVEGTDPAGKRWIEDVLVLDCTYTKRVYNVGAKRRNEKAFLFQSISLAARAGAPDRYSFPLGLYALVKKSADRDHVQIAYEDRPPVPVRPDALRFDWDALARSGFEFRGGTDGSQAKAMKVIETLVAHRMPGIVDASYGFGKTKMIVAACVGFSKARIAITNAVRSVVDDTYADLCRHLPPSTVGIAHSKRPKRHGRVTVYSADSLSHCPFEPGSGDYPDIVIGDEIQELATDERAPAVMRVAHGAAVIGLTGTSAGRSDGTDLVIQAIFGPVVFRHTYPQAVAAGLVTPIEVRMIRQQYANPIPLGAAPDAVKRFGFWRNEIRNDSFAAVSAEHVNQGDQVLILVDTTEHALYLRRSCRALGHDPILAVASMQDAARPGWERLGLITEDEEAPDEKQLNRLKEEFRRGEKRLAIATKVWRTGTSFDGLNVLIWAAGGRSAIPASQGPGRVSRIADGKTCGIVYDGGDQFDQMARDWADERKKVYRSPKHQWSVSDVEPIRPHAGAAPG